MRVLDVELKRAIQDMPIDAIKELEEKLRTVAYTGVAKNGMLNSNEIKETINSVRSEYGLESTSEIDEDKAFNDIEDELEELNVSSRRERGWVRQIPMYAVEGVLGKTIMMKKGDKYAEQFRDMTSEELKKEYYKILSNLGFMANKEDRKKIDEQFGLNPYEKINVLRYMSADAFLKEQFSQFSKDELHSKKEEFECFRHGEDITIYIDEFKEIDVLSENLKLDTRLHRTKINIADIAEAFEAREKELEQPSKENRLSRVKNIFKRPVNKVSVKNNKKAENADKTSTSKILSTKDKQLSDKIQELKEKIKQEKNPVKLFKALFTLKKLAARIEKEEKLNNLKNEYQKRRDELGEQKIKNDTEASNNLKKNVKKIAQLEKQVEPKSVYDYNSPNFIYPPSYVKSKGGIENILQELEESENEEDKELLEQIKEVSETKSEARTELEGLKKEYKANRKQLANSELRYNIDKAKLGLEETGLTVVNKFNIFSKISDLFKFFKESVDEIRQDRKKRKEIDEQEEEEIKIIEDDYNKDLAKLEEAYNQMKKDLDKKYDDKKNTKVNQMNTLRQNTTINFREEMVSKYKLTGEDLAKATAPIGNNPQQTGKGEVETDEVSTDDDGLTM